MKTLLAVLTFALSLSFIACEGTGENKADRTEEEHTTTTQDEMKTVQPVVDSAYDAATAGDSALLKDEPKQ